MRLTATGVVLSCGLACTAFGQNGLALRAIPLAADPGLSASRCADASVVYSRVVHAPNATSLRIAFGDAVLPGDPETETAAYIRITSLADHAVQRLNPDQLRQWQRMSAFFNGDTALVEIVAPAGGESRIVIDRVLSDGGAGADSLCGSDDRALSGEGRLARMITPTGVCTAFIISDSSRCLLTAGQCAPVAGTVIEFDAPLSTPSGAMVHPPPESQYAVDLSSVQGVSAGIGNDWSYFGVYPNSNTGLGAAAAQGAAFNLRPAPAPTGQLLRLDGFGSVSAPIDLAWNHVRKAAIGPYLGLVGTALWHQLDTTNGDVGAPVTLGGDVIAINTTDGCQNPPAATYNLATAIQNPGLQAALAAPGGLCTHAGGPPQPPIYLATDAAGNLTTIDRSSGSLGVVGATGIPGRVNGLAYDRGRGRFYASEFINGGPDRLYTLDQATGAATLVGEIVGPPDVSGLAFDPNLDVLYGIDQGSGQLYRINFNTAAALPVGTPWGPGVGGIEFDPSGSTLYGLDDSSPSGTRLVRIDTATGARSTVGLLGPGITDCDGLAFSPDERMLYSVDQPTGHALRIDPNTGTATVFGAAVVTGGTGYGMAAAYECAPPCIPNAPIPAMNAQQQPITTNLTWLGCPNQKAFGVDSNPNLAINLLDDISTASGGSTVIGPTTPGSQQITGMCWAGSGMYAIDLSNGMLLTINTLTGTPTPAGQTGITGWQDLASDPTDNGQLYGITQTNRLYRLGFNGSPSMIASNVGSLVTAMAFDRVGQLWGIEFSTGRVLQINKSTGAINPTATTIAGFQGLDFDDAGTAYGHNSGTDSLYTIDLRTGMATLRGPSSTDSVRSLAFGRATDFGGISLPPDPGARQVYDPTNLTESAPVMIDPGLVIDFEHHGLPPGFTASRGVVNLAGEGPWSPPPPDTGGADVPCGGTLVSFDDAPAPCAFGLATRITSQYTSRGIVFEGPGGADGPAVLNQCANLGISGLSGANCLAVDPSAALADGGLARGPLTLRFPNQISSFQCRFASATPCMVTIEAYRGGTLVASRSATLTNVMSALGLLGSGITRILITGTGPFAIDDLCYVESCPTTYDVYLDTQNPPATLVGSDVVSTVFDPGSLRSTTVYYWRIVARNCCGRIEGPVWRFTTICYPNCDASTFQPFLNVNDFICFLNRFTAGDPWANCDDSTVPPVLNVNDFTCFINKFAAGCPE